MDGEDADRPPEVTWVEWLAGWLLAVLATVTWAALVGLQLGHLSAAGLVAVAVLAAAGYLVGSWRWHWLPGLPASWFDRSLALAPVVIALLALWRLYPAASPWVSFLDGGWYLNAGARMAREERLLFRPEVLRAGMSSAAQPWKPLPSTLRAGPEAGADQASSAAAGRPILVSTLADGRRAGLPLPDDASRGFHAVAFAVPDAQQAIAVPYHPPFYGAWIAAWLRLRRWQEAAAAGNAVLPWSLAYLLSAGALATAAFGSLPGVLTMGMVLLGPAYAYYGATPYAEMTAGSLALAALWLLSRMNRRRDAQLLAAAGAGLLLGLATLAKPESGLVLAVALAWWLLHRCHERSEGLALLAGAAVPLLHAAILAATVSRFYFDLNSGGVLAHLRSAPLRLGAGGLLVLGLAWLTMAPADWVRGHERLWRPARRWSSVVVLAGLAGLLLLGRLAPSAAPPGLIDVLAWLLTPLGLWAAATGLVLLLESGRSADGPAAGVVAVCTPLWLFAPLVTTGLSPLYGARRLVPVVLPLLTALAAWFAVVAARRQPQPWLRGLVLVGTGIVLVGLVAAASPLAGWREWSGSGYIAQRIASHTGDRDVLLFPPTLGNAEAGRMAAAVWSLADRAAGVIGSAEVEPPALDGAIAAWRSEGRRVFVVTDLAAELPSLEEHELELVAQESLVSRMLSPAPVLPARSAVHELRFDIYEAVPAVDSD